MRKGVRIDSSSFTKGACVYQYKLLRQSCMRIASVEHDFDERCITQRVWREMEAVNVIRSESG